MTNYNIHYIKNRCRLNGLGVWEYNHKDKKFSLVSKNYKNIKITYLHAREIVERLGDGSLDIGFSGYDLLKESEINIQNKIKIIKKVIKFICTITLFLKLNISPNNINKCISPIILDPKKVEK